MREGFLKWYASNSEMQVVGHPEVDVEAIHREFHRAIRDAGAYRGRLFGFDDYEGDQNRWKH